MLLEISNVRLCIILCKFNFNDKTCKKNSLTKLRMSNMLRKNIIIKLTLISRVQSMENILCTIHHWVRWCNQGFCHRFNKVHHARRFDMQIKSFLNAFVSSSRSQLHLFKIAEKRKHIFMPNFWKPKPTEKQYIHMYDQFSLNNHHVC